MPRAVPGNGAEPVGVLDYFAVRMHDLEWSRILRLHPAHQHVFELLGINLFEQPSEGPLQGTSYCPGLPGRGRQRRQRRWAWLRLWAN